MRSAKHSTPRPRFAPQGAGLCEQPSPWLVVLVALRQRGQRRHVHGLAQPEVRQLDVAVARQQQVVGLDVPGEG